MNFWAGLLTKRVEKSRIIRCLIQTLIPRTRVMILYSLQYQSAMSLLGRCQSFITDDFFLEVKIQQSLSTKPWLRERKSYSPLVTNKVRSQSQKSTIQGMNTIFRNENRPKEKRVCVTLRSHQYYLKQRHLLIHRMKIPKKFKVSKILE